MKNDTDENIMYQSKYTSYLNFILSRIFLIFVGKIENDSYSLFHDYPKHFSK